MPMHETARIEVAAPRDRGIQNGQSARGGRALLARIAALEAEVERLTEAVHLARTPWRLKTVQADFFPAR